MTEQDRIERVARLAGAKPGDTITIEHGNGHAIAATVTANNRHHLTCTYKDDDAIVTVVGNWAPGGPRR